MPRLLHGTPGLGIRMDARGPRQGMLQRRSIHRRKLEAGGNAGIERRVIGIDHRIGKTAGARHHGHAAIAQAIELGQAAGLEARRHQDGVCARLQQMREALVIADDDADAALVALAAA